MKFLGKLLIASLLFFGQIGSSYISGVPANISLSFLVTLLYGFWCDNYILGFINGILSWSSFFIAIGFWYYIHGGSFWNTFPLTAPAFYGLALVFGVIGILSIKFGRWFRRKYPVESTH